MLLISLASPWRAAGTVDGQPANSEMPFLESNMTRQALTDGSGAWFNTDSAILFKEDTNWDGRNQISVPTGSQWLHEYLYYTKSGKWVLNDWSNYQGSLEGYKEITEAEAIAWLVLNNCAERKEMEELPGEVRESVEAGIAAAEI